jgi:2-phosphoglycerate kinase
MLTLIGGPPRCGKSSIARAWATMSASSFLPADYLTSAVSGYLDDEDTARLLPRLPGTFRDNDAKYENFSIDSIIENYRTKAISSWSAVRTVAEYAHADGNNFVIEGYQIEPLSVASLRDDLGAEAVRCLFAYRTDVDATRDALQRHRVPNDWAHEFTRRPLTLGRIAEMICTYGTAVAAEAMLLGLPTISMDGDFTDRVEAALAMLSSG